MQYCIVYVSIFAMTYAVVQDPLKVTSKIRNNGVDFRCMEARITSK